MDEKQRLLALISEISEVNSFDNGEFIETTVNWEEIVDHLLENGVLVSPVNIGQTYYCIGIDEDYPIRESLCVGIEHRIHDHNCFVLEDALTKIHPAFGFSTIGSIIFKSREDAEQRLEEYKDEQRAD